MTPTSPKPSSASNRQRKMKCGSRSSEHAGPRADVKESAYWRSVLSCVLKVVGKDRSSESERRNPCYISPTKRISPSVLFPAFLILLRQNPCYGMVHPKKSKPHFIKHHHHSQAYTNHVSFDCTSG